MLSHNSVTSSPKSNGNGKLIFVAAAFVSALVLINLLVGIRILHWPFIENVVGESPFGDLGVLLAMADFLRENPNGNPYDGIEGYLYVPNYPLLLPKALGMLGLGFENLLTIGFVLAILVLASMLTLLLFNMRNVPAPKALENAVVLVFAFLSPPVMLLLERGNYDSLIFFMVTLACLWGVRNRPIAGGLFLIAAIFKFFPISAMIAIARRGRGLYLPAILLAAFALYVALAWGELAMISQNTPRPHWLGFGGQVFGGYLQEFLPGLPLAAYLGFSALIDLIGVFGGLKLYQVFRTDFENILSEVANKKFAQLLLQVGALVLLTAFLIGNSFDYRLVFILLPLSALLAASAMSTTGGRLVILGILISLFWSVASFQMQPFGDLILIPVMTLLTLLAGKSFKLNWDVSSKGPVR